MSDLYVNPGDSFPAGDYTSYDKVYLQNTTGVNGEIVLAAGIYNLPATEIRTTSTGTLNVDLNANSVSAIFNGDFTAINFTASAKLKVGENTSMQIKAAIDVSGVSFQINVNSDWYINGTGDQVLKFRGTAIGNVFMNDTVRRKITINSIFSIRNLLIFNKELQLRKSVGHQVSGTGYCSMSDIHTDVGGTFAILTFLGAQDISSTKFTDIWAITPFVDYNGEDGGNTSGITFPKNQPIGNICAIGSGL